MNTLLTFDSTPFTKHLVKADDRNMIDYIIREYGPALQYALSMFNGDAEFNIRAHYQDAYFKAILMTGNDFHSDSANQTKLFRRRLVDEDGNVHSTKGRYDELVDACILHFNSQIMAVLRGVQEQARQIYTVDVVGYENRTLKIILKTDGAIQP
ncbi:hypothetical protein ST201phi2-1p078 [Pseudomonas phage 201phi2-1]|uniref:Uncharacterized protein n=1 Tax=Pseudomonas phage 201phi2-1 TaxID=198110 RepID=B3FK53_BP201|nr:hypothetical protein ST201phi2-1p078 [Pseudomonas phage 201phi2-1]ABY62911.1 hypothetical protein 201phi2-1p078 [Pseudomonas phage 201phi2-1]